MVRKGTPIPSASDQAASRPRQAIEQSGFAATEPALAALEALRVQLGEVETGPPARGFGAEALKVGGKIFAALSNGKLLLKLPAARVAAMIADGSGEPFATGGRPMKEWVLASPKRIAGWEALAHEAREFVAGGD